MIPSIGVAEAALEEACVMNPGPWTDHSRHVAAACSLIAACCDDLDPDKAYVLGLLHDIGGAMAFRANAISWTATDTA